MDARILSEIKKAIRNAAGKCDGRGLLVILFFPALLCLQAQVPMPGRQSPEGTDSARAVTLYEQALQQYKVDSLNLALDLAGEALSLAMRSELEKTEIGILSLIADIYNSMALPGDAIPYYMRIANLQESGPDSIALAGTYRRIAENYHLEEVYQKEAEYTLKALRLVPPGDTRQRAELAEKTGFALLQGGMPDSAATWLDEARTLAGRGGETEARLLNLLVLAKNRSERYSEALEFNELLYAFYRKREDYGQMSRVRNNMGYDHSLTGDYRKAAVAYLEALEYGRRANLKKDDLALMTANAGICYMNLNDEVMAKEQFTRAITAFDETGNASEKSRLENILALVYYHEGDLYNAGLSSQGSIESARKAGDPEKLSTTYLTYSRILKEGNDPIQALDYYEKYLALRDSLAMEKRLNERERSRKRNQLEKSEKDLKIKLKEEEVQELAIRQLRLQLEKEEQEKELIRKEKDMQALEQERLRQSLVITRQKNAAERQKRENQILEQEKRISDLRLEQEKRVQAQQEQEIALLEKEQELDQLELNRQKNAKKILIVFIVLGVLITVLILGSLISSRKKNALLARQKKEIEQKNVDLESKNEEISAQRDEIEAQRDLVFKQKEEIEQYNLEVMKSIEYARKIQSSTLPDLSSLNTTVSEYFIFFRPRDIVSGDFFWTARVENETVLTVSDCTGHGVPGAFMSMLGMSLLKEIVQKEYITLPGVILRRLRKGIIAALGQKGISGEQRDGMDMALITIDHAAARIQFAGAYNSLYLIRKRDLPAPDIQEVSVFEEEFDNHYRLYEIPAEKMPIAHFERMDKFRTHEFSVVEGDNVYLFTDGYADQFGGPMGKKFKYKPFKRLLLQNAHLPMENQNKILEDTLVKWMGNIAQVDDICVMGLRMKGGK